MLVPVLPIRSCHSSLQKHQLMLQITGKQAQVTPLKIHSMATGKYNRSMANQYWYCGKPNQNQIPKLQASNFTETDKVINLT